MRTCLKHTLLGLLVVGSLTSPRTPAGGGPSMAAESHYPRIVRAVARMMPVLHLYRMPVDPETLVERTIDRYLTSLDFDRAYFKADDVARFRNEGADLMQRMHQGDMSWAFEVFALFKERVEDRVAHVDVLVETGFDFTLDERYAWRRRDADWPADDAAWNDLWRRKIKHEMIGRKVAEALGDGVPIDFDELEPELDDPDDDTSPEDHVRNRYRQYLIVLQDHEPEWVLQRFLSAFTQAFDPHSDYMSASADEDFDINMSLSLEGIGAQLTSEDGAAKVVRVIPAGPADRDGRLQAGDKIIAVGQNREKPENVLHWSLTRTVRRIRGPKGSRVVLVVIPATDKSGSTTVTIDLIRDEVRLEEQAARGEIMSIETPSGVTLRLGVIVLPTFYLDIRGRRNDQDDYRSSTRDVRNHIESMMAEDVDGILLDLRANGGGSLTEAIEMTGLFLEAGPIVQVKERRGVQVLRDPDPAAIYQGPLVVLLSRLSASASEILAGALQDYGRAVIVGDSKTHGKGTVQSVIPIDRTDRRMGSLKVTAASFHRVTGDSTQQRGVESDVRIPSLLDTMEVGEEYLRHPIPWSRVDPVPFRAAGDLSEPRPALARRAEQRIAEDTTWQEHIALLEELRRVREADDISLNLDDRLSLAGTENRLRDTGIQRRSMDQRNGIDLEKDRILCEALNVLADKVELDAAADGPTD